MLQALHLQMNNVPLKVVVRLKPIYDINPNYPSQPDSGTSAKSPPPLTGRIQNGIHQGGASAPWTRQSMFGSYSALTTQVNKKASTIAITEYSPINGIKVVDQFAFDAVYEPEDSTRDVYNDTAKQLVENALKGYNATIFAYGQTHTGKTYTMFGGEKTPGIINLALDDIFAHIHREKDRFFIVRLALLEIHKEQLIDLAAGDDGCPKKLRLRETSSGFLFVENLIEEICGDSYSAKYFVNQSLTHRHNSHVICRVIIESKQLETKNSPTPHATSNIENLTRVSEINFVVLAGSEGALRKVSLRPSLDPRSQHRHSEVETLKEFNAINRSLLMLGLVIQQLSEGRTQVANFRNSLLTRILQNALAGNSYTAIICCISNKAADMKQNLSTLKFGSTAKQVRTRPQLNGIFPIEHAVLPRLQIRTLSIRRSSDKGKAMLEEDIEPLAEEDSLKIREQLLKEIFVDKMEDGPKLPENSEKARESFASSDGVTPSPVSTGRGSRRTSRRMSWATSEQGHAILKLMAPALDDNFEEVMLEAPPNSSAKEMKFSDEFVYDNLVVPQKPGGDDDDEDSEQDEAELVALAAESRLMFMVGGGDSQESLPALLVEGGVVADDQLEADWKLNYVPKQAFDAVNERCKSMKRQLIAKFPAAERTFIREDDEFEIILERLCQSLTQLGQQQQQQRRMSAVQIGYSISNLQP